MITSQQVQSAWAMRARIGVAAVFFVNGAVLASWVPHIPAVQMKLGLNSAVLGFALLGMAAGALMGIPLAGWWIPRVGSRRVVRVSAAIISSDGWATGRWCVPAPVLPPSALV